MSPSAASSGPDTPSSTANEDSPAQSYDGTVPPPEGGTSVPAISGQQYPASATAAQTLPPSGSPPQTPLSNASAVIIGSLLGPYELLEKIGEGGMGAVYKARHQHLDKLVAVKVLPWQFTQQPDSVSRFKREMKAVGKIDHPNIVRAMDAGEINGTHFLAMEYVEGSDLAQLVKTKGPFSVPNACKAVRQAAVALSAAHAAGLVHRDIKPSNLLVAKAGQIKLLDLGLALLGEDAAYTTEVTAAGQAFGTPDYMAPEQWADAHSADARTDLYALGCTLFFLLTGRPPYGDDKHKHPLNKMTGHVTEPIPDLKAARSNVPDAVVAIYQKLMAKAPDDRYQTAKDLVDALAAFATGKPLLESPAAQPPSSTSDADQPISATSANLPQPETTEVKPPPAPPTKVQRTKADVGLSTGSVDALIDTARQCYAAYDYAQTVQLLKGVPKKSLTKEMAALLQQATERQVEVTDLWAEIEELQQRKRWKPMLQKLERLLKLKPGHANGKQLQKALQSYGGKYAGMRLDHQGAPVARGGFGGGVASLLSLPVLIGGGAAAALVLFAVIVFFQMNSTSVKLVIEDPSLKVQFSEKSFTIDNSGKSIKVKPGEQTLTIVQEDGTEIVVPAFVLKQGEKRLVTVSLVDGKPVVKVDGEPLDVEGQGATPPGGGTYALRFSKVDYVKSEPVEQLKSVVRTYEVWGTITQPQEERGDWLVEGFLGELKAIPNQFRFYTYHGHLHASVNSMPINQRFHLAGVNDGQQRRLYLNGRLIGQIDDAGTLNVNPMDPTSTPIVLGSEHFETHAELDAVRISSSARYTADFQPPDRFTADKDTEVLYNFEEGQGDVLKDSSGHNRHGKIVGAKWVRREGKPIDKTGWHDWPADAPKPAIAPFDATQARKHQGEWAAYLKVPVEWENSLGMKFRLIPPGEFTMGSTKVEIEAALKDAGDNKHWQECRLSEAPQHTVILTRPIYLGVNEVTQVEYEKVMGVNPSRFAPKGARKEAVAGLLTSAHPVEMVSWNDAAEFCAKLSQQESQKPYYFRNGETITALDGTGYRLPSEAEWEFACRAGTATKYWIGDQDADLVQTAWFMRNSSERTHAAGELKANPFGLADMHGNSWEWVQDSWDATSYGQFSAKPAINPSSPFAAGPLRVIRGGVWYGPASFCRSSSRDADAATNTGAGFRVSMTVDAVRQAMHKQASVNWPSDAPKPAVAPFDAAQANKHQEEWAAYLKIPVEWENSLGMKFRLIPPGEFTMGSSAAEIATVQKEIDPKETHRLECARSEAPQHKVILTHPFYLGMHEVTLAEYEKMMGKIVYRQSVEGEATRMPVENVNWNESAEFCIKLSQQEKLNPFYQRADDTVTPLQGTGYRLPSEAEWEFACRAGTITKYVSGNRDEDLMQVGWWGGNSSGQMHAVGQLKPNPFGLYDLHGNHCEWVEDGWDPAFYGHFQDQPAINPSSPFSDSTRRMLRGGGSHSPASHCRSACRYSDPPTFRHGIIGFRVAIPVEAVRQKLNITGPTIPTAYPVANAIDDPLERKVAEWLLRQSIAILILIDGKQQEVRPGDSLPSQPFVIREFRTPNHQEIPEDELKTGLQQFRKLKQFVGGYLPQKQGDLWLKAWGDIPGIMSINAYGSDLTDDGLLVLSRFPKLTYVHVGGCDRITAQGLAFLADCKSLETVEVSKAHLDAGNFQLADLQKLQNALPRARIVFEGVLPIPGLKPAK